LVGDQFEITLRNWNPCNPYFGGLGTPVETTAIIEIIAGPLLDAGPDQTICEGDNATMAGSFLNALASAELQKKKVKRILKKAGVDPVKRPEELSLQDFANIANSI